MNIEISIDNASTCYAVLITRIQKTEQVLSAARSDEDKLFWSAALLSLTAARDGLAQQMWPLSHNKKAA
ncbi:MAG: hypothetical protein ABL934_09775 [Lysobacteraceae bacterium]